MIKASESDERADEPRTCYYFNAIKYRYFWNLRPFFNKSIAQIFGDEGKSNKPLFYLSHKYQFEEGEIGSIKKMP